MDNKKSILCHWDLVRFIKKEHLVDAMGVNRVLSVCDGKRIELMIFLGKEENGENYEVRVYKAKAKDKYVPKTYDNILSYTECDEYVSFFFDEFHKGISFIEFLPSHPEYRERPVREIKLKV